MKYTRVRRAVSAVVIDSWDEDRNPEHIKVSGNVTFTPLLKDGDVVQWAGPNGPESLVLAPIQCRISDGIIMHRGGEGIYLAAGGEGCEPSLIQWKATFSNMQAGGWSFKLKPVMFDAVPDGEVDLTMVAPVAGASEPIVRGPAGTSIDNIKVDGAELVITARSEAGVFEMARIPLEDVVRAEADAAAKSAADSVRTEFTTAAASAKQSATSAATSARTAITKAGEATTQATNAKTSATAAKTSETNAASSASASAASAQTATSKASEATTQAGNAANSAGAAKVSETNALSSANAAKSSESSAKTSETNAESSARTATDKANESATNARIASSSASAADFSKEKAAESANNSVQSAKQAEGSASSAKADADRAARIADSTSWDGDKLTVNGKTSPSLRGPKGDPGDPGQDGKDGASAWADITGKPTSFPPSSHRHTSGDISDASNDAGEPRFGGRLIKARNGDGKIFYYQHPTQGIELSNKDYVDTAVAAKPDKSYVDSAVASEKARTVGMVWMVETEDAAKAKESSCQKGDFIQVAATGTAYQVTNSGLQLIGTSQNATNHTLDAATSPWATWSTPTVPWIKEESDSSGITLQPGQYRVEPLGGIARFWSVDNSTSTDITSPAVVGGGTLRAYSSKNPAQNVIITRLA